MAARKKLTTTRIEPLAEQVYSLGALRDAWNQTPESREFGRLRRDECELTLEEAASRLGLTTEEVCEIERGGRSCDWDEAAAALRDGGKGRRKHGHEQHLAAHRERLRGGGP